MTPDEINRLRNAGQLLAETLAILREHCRVGVSLIELDGLAHEHIVGSGATPAFLGYQPPFARRPYPASLCLSVNEVILHGIPDSTILRDGDILSIDCGICLDGMHADAARTLVIGDTDARGQELVAAACQALELAAAVVRPGARVGDISRVVHNTACSMAFSVVPDFGGHGIGTELHQEPHVANQETAEPGPVLCDGMALTIEPLFTEGRGGYRVLPDGWTVVTRDGSRAAHFEDTILVTTAGPEVVTASR